MPETQGPIQHLTLAAYLWLIPMLPLLAALACAYLGLGYHANHRENPKAPRPDAKTLRQIALGTMLGTFGVAGAHLYLLAQLPPSGRFLLTHLFRMVRIGQLDASFDLSLDPLSSVMCLVVTAMAFLVFAFSAPLLAKDDSAWRSFAWMNFLVFELLVVVLADNFVVLFFGWEGVAIATYALVDFSAHTAIERPSAGVKSFLVNRAGDAALLVGVALLFWGLGGSWADNAFIPDLNPRFAAVSANGAPVQVARDADDDDDDHAHQGAKDHGNDRPKEAGKPAAAGKALITLASYPGALVYLDDSRTPMMNGNDLLRAPFVRFAIPGGIHTFRIHPGAGLDDHIVAHVVTGGDSELSLVLLGPTLSFREIRDELALKNARSESIVRDTLVAKRALGGIGVVSLACALFFFAAAAKSAQFPLHAWLLESAVASGPALILVLAATATAGVYLVARLSFLFALSSSTSTLVAGMGALTALSASAMAMFDYDLRRIVISSAIAQVGFMMLGAGVGGTNGAVFHLVTETFALGCLFLAAHAVTRAARASEGDVRRMGALRSSLPITARSFRMACLAVAAAPVPGLAGFWSKNEIMVAAFSSDDVGHKTRWALFGAALFAGAIASFALWRAYFLAFEGRPPSEESDAEKTREPPKRMLDVLQALAGISVVASVLGLSSKWLGGQGESILEDWLGPSLAAANFHFDDAGLATLVAIAFLGVGSAYAGFSIARDRYGDARPANWEAQERATRFFKPIHARFYVEQVLSFAFARPVVWLSELAVDLDRWVIDGVLHGAGVLVRATAWVSGRVDTELLDVPGEAAAAKAATHDRIKPVAALGGVLLIAIALYLFLKR
jgi:NADH-quinone oxidoreductase subunit L